MNDPAQSDNELPGRFSRALARIRIGSFLSAAEFLHFSFSLIRLARAVIWGTPRLSDQVLVLGTFHNPGWVRAHLDPLIQAFGEGNVTVIADSIETKPRCNLVLPNTVAKRLIGSQAARFFSALATARLLRPKLVVGYHIMPHGIAAVLVASLYGAKSVYQMTSGPRQLVGGGFGCGNAWQSRLGKPSSRIENLLQRWLKRANYVIVRGSSAAEYVVAVSSTIECQIITAGVDFSKFGPGITPEAYKIVTVCRLVRDKGVERLVRVLSIVEKSCPNVNLSVIGDGPLLPELRKLSEDLKLNQKVTFVGQLTDVADDLRSGRVFALLSNSEGMPISMLEAMACGLPVVVTAVGDIPDLIQDEVHGSLIDDSMSDNEIADRILYWLGLEHDKYKKVGDRVRLDAESVASVDSVARRWRELESHQPKSSKEHRDPASEGPG